MSPGPSVSIRLTPGVLVAGKYRLLRPLGEGAMGVVWAAMNETTVREVALKLIARPDPELRRRLQREARACGALRHPNIVDVYDVAQTDTGDPLLVMELLTGQSVAELLAGKRRLEPALAAWIARDVAGALAAAHAQGIIHRDLKPANLFLHRPASRSSHPAADDPVVKVLDFGVAKHLGATDGYRTAEGGAVGSPFYMSPEQFRADPDLDPRSDLWSLGVVLFEMLAGVRPFQGDSLTLPAQILSGEIPKLSRFLRHADERLVEVVDRCLRRRREERFARAEEVADRLDAFLGYRASMAPEPEPRLEEDGPTLPIRSSNAGRALSPRGVGADAGAGAGVGAGGEKFTARGTLKMSRERAAEVQAGIAAAMARGGATSTTPLTRVPAPAAIAPAEPRRWTGRGIAALSAVIVAGILTGVGIARTLLVRKEGTLATSSMTAPAAAAPAAPADPAAGSKAAAEAAAAPVTAAEAAAAAEEATAPAAPVDSAAAPEAGRAAATKPVQTARSRAAPPEGALADPQRASTAKTTADDSKSAGPSATAPKPAETATAALPTPTPKPAGTPASKPSAASSNKPASKPPERPF